MVVNYFTLVANYNNMIATNSQPNFNLIKLKP
jgi:hypothetical protein